MKKFLAIVAMLAIPSVSMAAGLIGDCYDCHTMHNSESGAAVAIVDGAVSTTPIQNLLKLDCMACHAMDPAGADKIVTLTGGSEVPQVAHADSTGDLAGGNFSYGIGGNGSVSKVHNVKELFAAGTEHNGGTFGTPPGMVRADTTHSDVFTTTGGTGDFDQFSCAGARGCHGTRQQVLVDGNGTADVLRTGMAAISGAHHNSFDGAKTDAGYIAAGESHNGKTVAAGYRFIPGLNAYGNETDRWQNVDANSHNEYYGNAAGLGTACTACHNDIGAGLATTMKVPNNSMSGFCSTCHGMFHSAGGGDYTDNGVSGAFLRHPSDYVLPAGTTEYANYIDYDISAPVARPSVLAAASATVNPGADMVMCLSCHQAHGSANDYILRFDYSTMYAGGQATIADAQGLGGCLACHTEKGVAK